MKLFLASEGKHPDSIEKLREFVGGFEGKSLVYIPTAANGDKWNRWIDGGGWNLVQTLGADITLALLEECTPETALEKISGKDILWFGGGRCGYLLYWIRRMQLDLHIKPLLDEGSVYVGSSAGAMITGSSLDIVEWYSGENEHGASVIPGLGLVDFDILPHYREDMDDAIKQNYKGDKLYLLKNGEEVIIDGSAITCNSARPMFVRSKS
ncbi:MAG: peptidase E [bacterium]|nr:peptidase E [bacterium]